MVRTLQTLLRNLVNGTGLDAELDDELRSCVQILTAQKIREGLPRREARRQALLEVGGVEQLKEQIRDDRWGSTLEGIWRDIRFAGRALRRNPGFTLVAGLTLGLGLGATGFRSIVEPSTRASRR